MSEIISISAKLPPAPPPIEFWSPSQFADYDPPADFVLVGDHHIVRGGITVIGGPPGVGKSRTIPSLAVSGATKRPWMGVDVLANFKTLVVQVENGAFRLKNELAAVETPAGTDLDEWLKISPPPPYGLDFGSDDFCEEVKATIESWEPGVVVLDPWNRVCGDDDIRSYRKSLETLFSVLPADMEKRPALVIVHHLRKRKGDHRKGRDLLEELAGSYSIGSAARCVYVMQPATPDPEDNRVVWTCAKSNDGLQGAPSAWFREDGGFVCDPGFDMEDFLAGAEPGRKVITAEVVESTIGGGDVTKSEFVGRMKIAGFEKSAAYAALKRFDQAVEDSGGKLWWQNDST